MIDPCVLCGRLQADTSENQTRRIDGARFGIAGKLCVTCYTRLRKRDNRANGAMPNWRYKATWEPCVTCGDPDGAVLTWNRCVTPSRTSGARFGISGDMCHRCYHNALYREKRSRARCNDQQEPRTAKADTFPMPDFLKNLEPFE